MRTKLPCPNCDKEFSASEILEASTIAWPELNGIYFHCPSCLEYTHILIEEHKMATVHFLGAPGPNWEINTPMVVEGLSVRIDPSFVHIWFNGKHYEYKADR